MLSELPCIVADQKETLVKVVAKYIDYFGGESIKPKVVRSSPKLDAGGGKVLALVEPSNVDVCLRNRVSRLSDFVNWACSDVPLQ